MMMSAYPDPSPSHSQYCDTQSLPSRRCKIDKNAKDDCFYLLRLRVSVWWLCVVSELCKYGWLNLCQSGSEVFKLTQMVLITSYMLCLTLALWHRNRTKRWWSCQDWVFFHLINKSSMSETSTIDGDQLVRYENGNGSSYYGEMRKYLYRVYVSTRKYVD